MLLCYVIIMNLTFLTFAIVAHLKALFLPNSLFSVHLLQWLCYLLQIILG